MIETLRIIEHILGWVGGVAGGARGAPRGGPPGAPGAPFSPPPEKYIFRRPPPQWARVSPGGPQKWPFLAIFGPQKRGPEWGYPATQFPPTLMLNLLEIGRDQSNVNNVAMDKKSLSIKSKSE